MKVTKIAILAASITVSVTIAQAAEVPDALTVEWQGKHPCEKLFEDAQVRVALYFPARNCARLPLASVIPDVRAKRWSGSGARRKGYAQD